MIADMINDKILNPVITELFIRGRKLNISIVFTTKSYFKVPKDVKFYTLSYYEDSKQKRTSANCFKSFIRY